MNLAGAGALMKSTAGTVTLTKAGTFTGSTTINGGTLTVAAVSGSALATTSGITVNAGGTLLLGANDQINNAAGMTLAGGTFQKGNFGEGTTGAVGVGALTLSATGSHLDFGTGTVGTVSFASFSPATYSLTIDNWTGTASTLGTIATDRLIFDSDQTANLSKFVFTGYSAGAAEFALGGGYFEVTAVSAVPEPSTYAAGCLALIAVAYSRRKRFVRRKVRKRR
jgi:autotransporter-associated beta strand protein